MLKMQESFYNINTNKIIEPVTIALIADLHGKPYKKVIDSLYKKHPDIIAIVGDVVNDDYGTYPLDFFGRCTSISPSFLSLGNHERKITYRQINDIANTGVVVLDNEWTRWNDNIIIGGMTSPFVSEWRETHKTELCHAIPKTSWLSSLEEQDEFKILLDHHPENYERVTKSRSIDLILSGHAHGGQIRLFNHGLYAPHQGFLPKYTSGVYENRLIVSRGLANIKPIPRLWNPTELVYIEVSHIGSTR